MPQAIGISLGCNEDILFWNTVYEGGLGWSSELLEFGTRVYLSDLHRLIDCGGNVLRPPTVEASYIIRVVPTLLIACNADR